jgi:Xaa-Pro aminopeptidase
MAIKRLQKVQTFLKEEGLPPLLVENPIDLFYLTGLSLSLGRLWITQSEMTLFVDGRYFEAAKEKAPCDVRLYNLFQPKGKKACFDSLNTTFAGYQDLLKLIPEWIPLEGPIKRIRQIKEPAEIKLMKESAKVALQGFAEVKKLLKTGSIEKEIATELEIFWKRKGAESSAFDPIIAFGAASSQPHYRAALGKLKQDDIALIDIGVMKDHYASDMTRVLFFGDTPEKLLEIYQVVDEAKNQAIRKCRPGVQMKEVDQAARLVIEKAGYKDYFPHSLGHGVGLEVHEWPIFKAPFEEMALQEGMVLTIEPGIYLPGIGGVRLEETIAITGDGHEIITSPLM